MQTCLYLQGKDMGILKHFFVCGRGNKKKKKNNWKGICVINENGGGRRKWKYRKRGKENYDFFFFLGRVSQKGKTLTLF